jgi:hypothetical protein
VTTNPRSAGVAGNAWVGGTDRAPGTTAAAGLPDRPVMAPVRDPSEVRARHRTVRITPGRGRRPTDRDLRAGDPFPDHLAVAATTARPMAAGRRLRDPVHRRAHLDRAAFAPLARAPMGRDRDRPVVDRGTTGAARPAIVLGMARRDGRSSAGLPALPTVVRGRTARPARTARRAHLGGPADPARARVVRPATGDQPGQVPAGRSAGQHGSRTLRPPCRRPTSWATTRN